MFLYLLNKCLAVGRWWFFHGVGKQIRFRVFICASRSFVNYIKRRGEFTNSSGKKPSYQEAAIELGKELNSICSQLTKNEIQWYKTENWLRQQYAGLHPGGEQNVIFRILGYQWHALHFTEYTRQSTMKIMVAYKESDPGSQILRQEAYCSVNAKKGAKPSS